MGAGVGVGGGRRANVVVVVAVVSTRRQKNGSFLTAGWLASERASERASEEAGEYSSMRAGDAVGNLAVPPLVFSVGSPGREDIWGGISSGFCPQTKRARKACFSQNDFWRYSPHSEAGEGEGADAAAVVGRDGGGHFQNIFSRGFSPLLRPLRSPGEVAWYFFLTRVRRPTMAFSRCPPLLKPDSTASFH